MAYTLDGLHVVDIGWTGENNATSIVIDVEKWMTRWPDAAFDLAVCRPKEDLFYPVAVEFKNHYVVWRPKLPDVEIPGYGEAVLYARSTADEVIAKHPFRVKIDKAPDADMGDVPEAGEEYLQKVFDSADRAEAASKQAVDAKHGAEAAAEQAEENVRTALQEAKDSGEFDGAPGEDGYTPVKGVDYFDGAPGTSGVHLGTEAPTDDNVNVWIDPEGKGTETLPNPHPLVINGVSYDGSDMVNIAIDEPKPYTLPVATRETLGGVKVGEGLTVDETGVLGVKPECEYEIIEVITLKESVKNIVRTIEPDGTPYNFDAIHVVIDAPAYEEELMVYVNIGNTGNTSVWAEDRMLYQGDKVIKKIKCSSQFSVYNDKGVWRSIISPPSGGAAVALKANNYVDNNGPVKAVRIFPYSNTTDIIPDGVTITIKGVRADA